MTDLINLLDESPLPQPSSPLVAIRDALRLLDTDIDSARELLSIAVHQLTTPVTAPTEGVVRRDAAGTSRAAAAAVQVRTGSQRARVLLHLVRNGPATDLELQRALGLSPNSERPRRGELVAGGFVADTGETRMHHDAAYTVWAATDHGRAAAGELSREAAS